MLWLGGVQKLQKALLGTRATLLPVSRCTNPTRNSVIYTKILQKNETIEPFVTGTSNKKLYWWVMNGISVNNKSK